MNLEEIQQLQPELVERFTQILEHKQLKVSFAKICRESGLVANAGPVA